MTIVSHIFFSNEYQEGKTPFHTAFMGEEHIPRINESVVYDENVFNFDFSEKILLVFVVKNVIYRYERNETGKLITFIDVILKSDYREP